MSTGKVVIVRTGSANIASVSAAFARLGVASRTSEDAAVVAEAPLVVLPGVGVFGAGMEHLRSRGLDDAIVSRCRQGCPLLAICLGMQLLCGESEETPGVRGLGVVEGRSTRFGTGVRVPQMGWNTITPDRDTTLLRPAWMYFANSFRLASPPPGWRCAMTDYGGPFISAIERAEGSQLACQFHPELSGAAGLALLERWLVAATGWRDAGARRAAAC